MSVILQKMLSLFLLLMLGFLCNKIHLLDSAFCTKLSKLVANVTMPAMVLYSAMGNSLAFSGKELLFLVGIALAMFVISFVAALVVPPLLRPKKEDMGTYRFMALFPNTAFIGYPVVTAIFGNIGVLYAAVFNLPFNFGAFSLGPLFLASGGKKKFNPKVLINPGIFAALGALTLLITGFRFPFVIEDMVGSVGSTTTPLAMMIIGSNLADSSFKEVFGNPRIYFYTLFRLALMPVCMWLVLRPFVADPVILGTAVVLVGMPAATNVTVLSAQYGGNERLGSQGVLMTTLFSVITIPLLMYFLFVR